MLYSGTHMATVGVVKGYCVLCVSCVWMCAPVSRELGVNHFDVVMEDDGSALSPTVVDHILEFGLDAGRLMVVPTPGAVNDLLTCTDFTDLNLY